MRRESDEAREMKGVCKRLLIQCRDVIVELILLALFSWSNAQYFCVLYQQCCIRILVDILRDLNANGKI